GTRRVFEAKNSVVLHILKKRNGPLEVFNSLAGKADDDVSRNADGSPCRLDPGNSLQIFLAGIEAHHGLEHPRRAALHRQMHVVAKRGNAVDSLHNVAGEISGMRSSETHAANSRDLAYRSEKIGEGFLAGGIEIGIYILPKQLNL